MGGFFDFSAKLLEADKKALKCCKEVFGHIDEIAEYNQQKMLKAFIKNKVREAHFAGTTGYGYGDVGRDNLERVLADCFGTEDSLIRHNFMSGTHTLTVALFGVLRPGMKVLCVTGPTYDTLIGVIGKDRQADGSLRDFGIDWETLNLKADGSVDIDTACNILKKDKFSAVYIQRSRGYSLRPSLTAQQVDDIALKVKQINPEIYVIVDNCYGEFTCRTEPTKADLIAGSLIKNPGGGIASTGGYIAGRKDLIEKCANRLTAPGVGKEIGATLGHSRELYMGLFAAPHVTAQALKTAVYAAALFELFGYGATPRYNEERADIIQCLLLENSKSLIAFCQGIQSGSPVDSDAIPEPWDMPGYDDKIIMAAGAFTLGASAELSADAPLREPYAVWCQGGTVFEASHIGILCAAQNLIDKGLLKNL